MNIKKMTTVALGIAGLALMVSLQGCATAAEKRVDAKVAAEPAIQDSNGLEARVQQALKTATWLSNEQRNQIASIRKAAQERLDAEVEEELRLRAILLKDLVAIDYDESEVAAVSARIKSLRNKSADELRDEFESERRALGREIEERFNFGGLEHYTGAMGSPGLISISI